MKVELRPLTEKQARVLKYIIEQVEAGNGTPTIREVCAEFGMLSTGSGRDIFWALVTKGYLVHVAGKSRGSRLNPKVFRVTVTGRRWIKIKKKRKK